MSARPGAGPPFTVTCCRKLATTRASFRPGERPCGQPLRPGAQCGWPLASAAGGRRTPRRSVRRSPPHLLSGDRVTHVPRTCVTDVMRVFGNLHLGMVHIVTCLPPWSIRADPE
jgi:hypothetical protein